METESTPPGEVTLATIRAAARALEGSVRRTPLLRVAPATLPGPAAACSLALKLENLQLSGSFKVRGATNYARGLAPDALARGLITASGGNHGLGVAAVARVAEVPATILVPASTGATKIAALERAGARVRVHGAVWDDANEEALAVARARGLTYVHPFEPPEIIAGQGTVGLEILEDAPDTETLVVAIGGGGLMAGIAVAARALNPGIRLRIIGVEPVGAPTLRRSLDEGAVITLPGITTRANTLAPRRSAARNVDIIRRHVDDIVLVEDADMEAAAVWLWRQCGVAAELSASAGVAALMTGKIEVRPGERVCAVVCGAGTAGIG